MLLTVKIVSSLLPNSVYFFPKSSVFYILCWAWIFLFIFSGFWRSHCSARDIKRASGWFLIFLFSGAVSHWPGLPLALRSAPNQPDPVQSYYSLTSSEIETLTFQLDPFSRQFLGRGFLLGRFWEKSKPRMLSRMSHTRRMTHLSGAAPANQHPIWWRNRTMLGGSTLFLSVMVFPQITACKFIFRIWNKKNRNLETAFVNWNLFFLIEIVRSVKIIGVRWRE